MPLAASDIREGAVAYFDVDLLNRDRRIAQPPVRTTRNGPFVCFEAADGRSAWAPLTRQRRSERLEISGAWRCGGSSAWQQIELFLNDGACTYVGPDQAFVDAARGEIPFAKNARPAISADGVARIVAAVEARGGRQL